ncbi:MAG TPA: efflux RND transporter permease subunit, partial [Verrucomicrobiae bacterium]|nr:efflux RND transporter permease subunit [Verrucomicrobiae bacterium]
GLSPEQVEALITRPVEAAVNGLGNMESLRSESISGLSILAVVFKEGSDILAARQLLAEKLSEIAGTLPLGAQSPRMSPLTSSTMDLLKIGLTSEKLSPMQLRTLADWTIRPRLLSVPGVARCIVFGGEKRQLQIKVQPDKLPAFGLALSDILAVARASTGVIGAGFIDTENQRVVLEMEGQALTAEILAEVVVSHTNGHPVRLRDVARVVEGAEPKFGDAVIQGKPGVLLSTASQFGANTLEVTLAVERALAEMKPALDSEEVTLHPRLHRPATFVETSLRNIKSSLLLGAVLVAAILFLFLGQFRAALISLTAIPLSLLTAVILLDRLGISLNTITLGGLAIAIGEVVDDAIIDVENIFRRLRENQSLASPRPVFQVVYDASIEVRGAVVYATFIVALVFVPVLTLTGLQGKFFAPLALSYILAILASLAVALTLTPALSLLFFSGGPRATTEPRLQIWLKRRYEAVLGLVARWPRAVAVGVVLICVASLAQLPFFGSSFLPSFREGHFVLQVNTAPGTSLGEMTRLGQLLCTNLLAIKGVATVEQQVGRAEQGEDTFGPHRSEFHVELDSLSGEEQERVEHDIRQVLEKTPGIQFEVLTFLGDRIGETITGETAPVVVNIFGDDLNVLDQKAQEVRQILEGLPGAEEVQLKSPPGAPRLVIKLRPERLTLFGFRPGEIMEAVRTAFQGVVAAQVYEGNRVADVTVILDDPARRTPEAIGSLLLKSSQGLKIPLGELTEIYPSTGRSSILHEGARRRQTVTCNPQGADVVSFVAAARKAVAEKVKFPAGYYAEFGGAAEAHAAAQRELLLHSGMASAGILLMLIVVTGSWRHLLLILANLPFALVGGVFFVWLSGRLAGPGEGGLTVGSLVGFVTLFGITMRNSIMLISHYEHLVTVVGQPWNLETARRGASERLAPILMTAIVTGIGLLPLAMGSGEAGREIEGPMAIVILGGLITSTLLNLLILPALAARYGRFEPVSGKLPSTAH